jgi:hypothetical protein
MTEDTPEEFLSVIFLALICIVVAAITLKMMPSHMAMPSLSLIAVCLWISFDYINTSREKAKEKCNSSKIELEDIDDIDESQKTDISGEDIQARKKANSFDIDLFNAVPIEELHSDMGCSADTRITNRMKYMGLQAKLSEDIRARHNKDNLLPLFDEELRANEMRDWWDVESDHLDAFM